MVGTGLLVLVVLTGSYLLATSPALARHYGRRAASNYNFLPLKLFFLAILALFILVVGGLYFIFYFSALFTLLWPGEISPSMLGSAVGLTILFLEYHALRAFWQELRMKMLHEQIARDLF